MSKKPDQESFYEIHINKQNELMISIHTKESIPAAPVIIYDGGEHALFYRTPDQTVLLDFIHPDARPALLQAKEVLIAETQNFKVIREYTAVCKKVKNMPLDNAGLKPLLDKTQASQVDERHLYE